MGEFYSSAGWMADVSHTGSHAAHSMQSSVTTSIPSSEGTIASTGQALTHSLSSRHLSVSITYPATSMISLV